MAINLGYGKDFVEVTDIPAGGKQSILIQVQEWDNLVRDYIANRREMYRAAGLIDGVMFDDRTHDAEF
jgi:hypothetical protein